MLANIGGFLLIQKKLFTILRYGVFVIIAAFLFAYFSQTPSFSPPVAYAQCSVPSQVQNVSVTFPNCIGNSCNFTQGSCTWGGVTGATKYQVTITEVETNRQVQSQQVDSSVTNSTFQVTESNTYRCSVAAINSCGTGPAGTASLLCKVDAGVTTSPTAAVVPTTVIVPTAVVIPTTPPTAVPTKLLTAGSNDTLLFASIGSFVLIVIGMSLFIL